MDSLEQHPATAAWLSNKKLQADITEVPQCEAQPVDSTTPTTNDNPIDRSALFNFPTLSPDGSIQDLTAAPFAPTHSNLPTPPAALSSLGAKARMDHNDAMSDIASTIADSQYDMLDDLSGMSSDDRETASIASTEQQEGDGEMTPEDTGSMIDIDEIREVPDSSVTLGHSLDALLAQQAPRVDDQVQAENELLDSYMTEDLETPRQSVMRDIASRSLRQAAMDAILNPTSRLPPTEDNRPIRILFLSQRGVADDEIIQVCHRIDSCLTGRKTSPKAYRFPPTPSGIHPASGLLLLTGDSEIVIEHCVDAEIRSVSPWSYNLRIQDTDKDHTSVFTVGKDGKIDLETPDLAVFYLTEPKQYPSWFPIAMRAMRKADVPNITVGAPDYAFDDLNKEHKQHLYDSDIVVSNKAFYDDSNVGTWVDLETRLVPKSKSPSWTPRFLATRNTKGSSKQSMWRNLLEPSMLIPLLVTLGFFLLAYRLQPSSNPIAELAIRRDALATAMFKVTNSTETTKLLNLNHLIPPPLEGELDGLNTTARSQYVPPNHMVVSIPKEIGSRRFPEVRCSRVYKADDGPYLTYNLTKLIDGVYRITIDPQDAYGRVMANITTKNPFRNVAVSENFGSRILRRTTYGNARTNLSKVLNKDVAVASHRLKSLKERVGLELTAGAVATKNVTTQIAVYVARDLQVFAHTAVSVFGKAAAASNGTVTMLKDRVGQDIRTAKADVEYLKKNLLRTISATAEHAKGLVPSKKAVGASLALSRKRALGLKNRIAGRKIDTNSTSATKELSLRLQNIFKPTEKGKRAGSLSVIARCMRSEDYLACRKEQRLKQKAVAAYKPPGGLAKVPEKDLVAKHASKPTAPSCSSMRCKKAVKKAEGEGTKAVQDVQRRVTRATEKDSPKMKAGEPKKSKWRQRSA